MTHTTKLRAVLATVLLLAFAETQGAHYTIAIPTDDHRVAQVTATLMPDGPEFYMFHGAQQLPKRWATFVSDFEVRDGNGKTVPVVANDDGRGALEQEPARERGVATERAGAEDRRQLGVGVAVFLGGGLGLQRPGIPRRRLLPGPMSPGLTTY